MRWALRRMSSGARSYTVQGFVPETVAEALNDAPELAAGLVARLTPETRAHVVRAMTTTLSQEGVGDSFRRADLNNDNVIDRKYVCVDVQFCLTRLLMVCNGLGLNRREFMHFLVTQHKLLRTGDTPDGVSGTTAIPVTPTKQQLRRLFMRGMVPMIGFGFVDNVMMLMAGDVIDTQLGTTLHISTLAAAGLGNMVSDVAGLGLSSTIEAAATRVGLHSPGLSTQVSARQPQSEHEQEK